MVKVVFRFMFSSFFSPANAVVFYIKLDLLQKNVIFLACAHMGGNYDVVVFSLATSL